MGLLFGKPGPQHDDSYGPVVVDDAEMLETGEIQVRPGPLRVTRFRSLASIKPLRLWLSLACLMGTPGPPAPLAGGNLRTDPDPNAE